jgi:hypothetical protein
MKKDADMHFHYDPKYSVEEYCQYIKSLGKACIVIHAKQVKDKKVDWVGGMLEVMKRCNCEGAIELSIGKQGTTFSFEHKDIDIIHSLHSYTSLNDWIYTFKVALNKYDIQYICHPFNRHLPDDISIPRDMLEEFVRICNEKGIRIELNNRYMRQNEACVKFIEYIKRNAWYPELASDAHEPKKIGVYGNVFSVL